MIDKAYLICIRADMNPDIAALPESSVSDCSECGQQVLVSPSGRETIENVPDMVMICTFCSGRHDEWVSQPVMIRPEALKDMEGAIGKKEADAMGRLNGLPFGLVRSFLREAKHEQS